VFEVLCTVENEKAELHAGIVEQQEIQKMQGDSDKHREIYENVLDTLKNIDVEKAEARSAKDRDDILDKIRKGPGTLKTNLVVAVALGKAIQLELQAERNVSVEIDMLEVKAKHQFHVAPKDAGHTRPSIMEACYN